MNKDQVKGAAKSSLGKVQRVAGKAVGSRKQQIKGISKQVEGSAQQRFGDLKEAARTSRKRNVR